MRTNIFWLTIVAGAIASNHAHAQETAAPGKFSLTPHVGIIAESDLVDGRVRFSDGDIDFISVDPGTGVFAGIDVGYRVAERVTGFIGLSYASSDADYVERNNVRPDVEVDTIRIQPGIVVDVAAFGSSALVLGGGVTLAFLSVDRLVWNGNAVEPAAQAVGLFGLAGVNIGITPAIAFHARLGLEISKPFLDDFEDELALADGEAAAELDSEARTAMLLALGLNIDF
jgi:hypothetical protein